MTTEKSKTKSVSFKTSPKLMNEIISLSESQNILKSHFIQNLINDYFKTNPTTFNYYQVIDDSEKVHFVSCRLPNNIYDKINNICVSLDITKVAFLNYLLYELLIRCKDYETDNLKVLDKKKEYRKSIFKIYRGFFNLYHNRKSKTPISNETNEQTDIPDKSYSKQINKPVMKTINAEFIEQCNDEIKIETDSLELNEIKYSDSIKKRGRPSNKEVFYKYTDDKRVVNSFSDLKLNDIIYIVSNEFDNSPKEKYKTIKTSSDCILLPTLKKIKIHSFEVRGKFVMINRKSFNSNQFELELTINEYYNTLQVSRNGCVYSCLKSMYEEAKNKMVEYEIKSRLGKINNLNIEIELIKNL